MQKKVEKEGLLLETILELFSEQSHKKLKSYLKNLFISKVSRQNYIF